MSNTNLKAAQAAFFAALEAYVQAGNDLHREHIQCRETMLPGAVNEMRAATNMFGVAGVLSHGILDARLVLTDINSGFAPACEAVINPSVNSLDAKMSAFQDARKKLDEARQRFDAVLAETLRQAQEVRQQLCDVLKTAETK